MKLLIFFLKRYFEKQLARKVRNVKKANSPTAESREKFVRMVIERVEIEDKFYTPASGATPRVIMPRVTDNRIFSCFIPSRSACMNDARPIYPGLNLNLLFFFYFHSNRR